MATIVLTNDQRLSIKAQMDDQVEMLNDEEVEALATRLNKKINIPFIKEGTEQTILVKIVKKFDRILYRNLPNELYGLVKNSADGISDEEAEELKEVLANRLNAQFDLPYIPEILEQEIFEMLVGYIITAMREKFTVINQPE
jgi:2-oxo-4-hydroxy-4-carboxy--5-ureidoimidazoline (OHCU) decarboxylase